MRYLLSRSLYMLPVVWLVVSVVFLLIHLVPGDPIQQMLGEGAAATDLAAARHAYGLGCSARATVRELLARVWCTATWDARCALIRMSAT